MKGDFTRSTFKRKNHYRSVRMQQGRVQLDSDWNEQADINNYHIETDINDIIGRCGAPFHKKDEFKNFRIEPEGDGNDFKIAPGHIYVNGILCENDAPEDKTVKVSGQPDLPPLPEGVNLTDDMPFIPFRSPPAYVPGETYLAFLDVWRRHITSLEDESIREVALGGPDTATRAKTVWQVKFFPIGDTEADVNCLLNNLDFIKLVKGSTGKLSAKTTDAGTFKDDPCILPPGGGYRRLKNQLYRVEIHAGGNRDTATFKWSRDNGTVVVKWDGKSINNKLKVIDRGRSILSCFAAGKWVELTDDMHELWGLPGTLVKLTGDSSGEELTFEDKTNIGSIFDSKPEWNPKVRLWDSAGAVKVYIPGEDWVQLGDDGIQVKFETGTYRTGDYWLIPARTEKADIEWPLIKIAGKTVPEPQETHGIKHHYCRLALLEANTDGNLALLKDCRKLFPALTELTSLFYVSGDGQEAMPGIKLPEPLMAGVSNGQWPVEGALVRFEIETEGETEGSGTLTATNSVIHDHDIDPKKWLIIETDPDGVAQCEWTLGIFPDGSDPGNPDNPPLPQRVKATLVDANHDEEDRLPIFFNANLSVACQVAYFPQGCNSMATTTTVQNAIDRLSHLTSLFYVGGDGQEAMPGEPLPQRLQVIVANECGPVEGATVEFVAEENGRVAADETVPDETVPWDEDTTNIFTDTTGEDGIASCYWLPDENGKSSQTLRATLTATTTNAGVSNPIHAPTYIIFTANLSIAAEVAYRPACGTESNTTVRSELNIPTDEDSNVAGILDKLLCTFNATHLPILKDDSLCELLMDENVKTVQQALNALCKRQRGSGCCTVVGAAKDIGEIFDKLKDGDVICLLKGEPYDRDITIKGQLLFSWYDIPENEAVVVRFKDFLTLNYGVGWVEKAAIFITEDNMSIIITDGERKLSLNRSNENNELNFYIENVWTDKFIVKLENDYLNIYKFLNNIVIRGCSGGVILNSNIRIQDCTNITLENLEISGILNCNNVTGLFLRKNTISLNENQNIDIIECNNVRIEKNSIKSHSSIYITSGYNIEFYDNTVDYIGSERKQSSGIIASGCNQLKIQENRLNVDSSMIGKDQEYTHIEIQNGQQVEITGNYILTMTSGLIITHTIENGIIFGVSMAYIGKLKGPVLVNNNTISGTNGWAIYVDQNSEVRIQGNNISGSFRPTYCAVSARNNDRLELLDNNIASDHRAIEILANSYLNMGRNRIEISAISFSEYEKVLNKVVNVYKLTEGEITGNQIKIADSEKLSNESFLGLWIGEVNGFLSVNRNRIDGLNGNAIFITLLATGGEEGIYNLQGNLCNSAWYNDYLADKKQSISNIYIQANDISFIGNRCALTIKCTEEEFGNLLKKGNIQSVDDVLFGAPEKNGAITATGNRCVENLIDERIYSIHARAISKAVILLGNITTNRILPEPDPQELNMRA